MKTVRITKEEWEYILNPHYKLLWWAFLYKYTLTYKQSAAAYICNMSMRWSVYILVFLPQLAVDLCRVLWYGGLVEFSPCRRSSVEISITPELRCHKRAEAIWRERTENDSI